MKMPPQPGKSASSSFYVPPRFVDIYLRASFHLFMVFEGDLQSKKMENKS